jgi:hypothetical protein
VSLEQGCFGVSGGIASEKFKSTLSFVHCRYTQVRLSRAPRVLFFERVAGVGR